MERTPSFTTSKLLGNYSSLSYGSHSKVYESTRRPQSIRHSQRKPIFDKHMYFSTVSDYAIKRPLSYNEEAGHVKEITRDDFCGCEHNLDPCVHVMQLIEGLNERDMRLEYEQVDSATDKLSKLEVKRKYLRFLPPLYPELYHAQLASVVSNMGRDLSFNEFTALASIEYHAKL
jgi:hypothetical protein